MGACCSGLDFCVQKASWWIHRRNLQILNRNTPCLAHRAPQHYIAGGWKNILGKHHCKLPCSYALSRCLHPSPAPVTTSTQGWADIAKKPENSLWDTWYEGPGTRAVTVTLMLLKGSCMVTGRTETLPLLILHGEKSWVKSCSSSATFSLFLR